MDVSAEPRAVLETSRLISRVNLAFSNGLPAISLQAELDILLVHVAVVCLALWHGYRLLILLVRYTRLHLRMLCYWQPSLRLGSLRAGEALCSMSGVATDMKRGVAFESTLPILTSASAADDVRRQAA